MDRVYDVNMRRLALLALPTRWRKRGIGALLYAMVSPLSALLSELQQLRGEQLKEAERNGQVCRLRRVIRETAMKMSGDPEKSKQITIEDAESGRALPKQLVAIRTERAWQMVSGRMTGEPLPVSRRALERTNCDFWVNVPRGLLSTAQEQRLRAVIDRYKLTTKRYEINYK